MSKVKLTSTMVNDPQEFVIQPASANTLWQEWAEHNNSNLDPYDFGCEVVVEEDGVPKIYGARFDKYAGWCIKAEMDGLPTLWLEFCRSLRS
jgi:hypothetical protein